MGDIRHVYKILIGKSELNRPHGVQRYQKDNKVDLINRVTTQMMRLMIATRSTNVCVP
jgi:hypothetical protein